MNSGKILEPFEKLKKVVFLIILGLFNGYCYRKYIGGLRLLISLISFSFVMKPVFCAFLKMRKLLLFKKV